MVEDTQLIMGMPVKIKIVDKLANIKDLKFVFDYFRDVDQRYSPFKTNNQLHLVNSGKLKIENVDKEMQMIFALCEQTKKESNGFFDIYHQGKYNPSGLVKGWAIKNAADKLKHAGWNNFYVDAGGDIQVAGKNESGKPWKVGIRNPFNRYENIKVFELVKGGVATSGTSIRGEHIYSPFGELKSEIVSLTVVGPDVYEADRFATAAFAMGAEGINFIAKNKNLSGYMIDKYGQATFTDNFGN